MTRKDAERNTGKQIRLGIWPVGAVGAGVDLALALDSVAAGMAVLLGCVRIRNR